MSFASFGATNRYITHVNAAFGSVVVLWPFEQTSEDVFIYLRTYTGS